SHQLLAGAPARLQESASGAPAPADIAADPDNGCMHADGDSIQTLAVHAGERRPGPEGSVVFPIYQGTVFSVEPRTDYHDISCTRLTSRPSQRYLHDKLAALEGAEAAVATSSGMAAITAVLLSTLRAGDHLLASEGLYGGTHDFLTHHAADLG